RRVGTRARYDNSLPEPIWRRVVRALAVPPIPPAHGVPPPRSGANPVAQVWLIRNASRIGGVARWQRFRGRRGGVATALREKKARWRRNQVGVRGAGVGNRSCTPRGDAEAVGIHHTGCHEHENGSSAGGGMAADR